MRFGLGLILALSMAGPCAAGIDWSKYDVPPPTKVIPLDQGARPNSISLARMGANLRDGEAWAEIWRICAHKPDRVLNWQAKDNQFSTDRELDALFRQELTNAGFNISGASTNLFESEAAPSDLEVGALITKLHVSECFYPLGGAEGRGPFQQMGAATMAVEWQIYSISEAKVVARITTEGGFKDKQTGQMLTPYVAQVFAENVRQLAMSPEFRQIVLSTPKPTPPLSAPTLRITLLRPVAPVPLNQGAKGVVLIRVGGGFGSGVLISPDGYILTNHHVAGGLRQVRVRWADRTEAVADVVRSDRARDVALLKVDIVKERPLPIRLTSVELGENVYAIGTPLDGALQNTVTRGIVSGTRIIEGRTFIQSDTPVTHGNSGGPLVDNNGAVVGLTDWGVDPAKGSTLNFFIPIGDALQALNVKPAS